MPTHPDQILGAEAILKKLTSLPATKHEVSTIDVQPTSANGAVVFVTGNMAIGGDNPLKYSQVFTLLPADGGSFWVYNDIFRLVYA